MVNWLISAEQLADCYRRQDVLVVDCRFSLADTGEGERSYREAHIGGAHYMHLDRNMSAAKGAHGGRHPLPDLEQFAATLSKMGANQDTLIVAYDSHRFAFAARLWWLLRHIGHDNVRILDGGYGAWCNAGFAVDAQPPTAIPGNIRVEKNAPMVVGIDYVKAIRSEARSVLIDSRERERFLGLSEPIDPVAGHIEGAVNFPWQQVTDETGKFKPVNEQHHRLSNIASREEIIVYCGSGVTACVNLLALAAIGREDCKLYAGGWSDWCSYLPQ